MSSRPISTMQDLTKQEARKIQLSLLDTLDAVCREHGVRYSLYGGTLLGAMRHKGYIPWDDDIDVIMPRKDYEIFRENFSRWAHPEYVHLQDYRTNPHFYFPFIKLSDERTILQSARRFEHTIGIDLDIFPLDNMPCHVWTALPWLWVSHFLRKCQSMAIREAWVAKKTAWYEAPAKLLFRILTLGCGPIPFCRMQDAWGRMFEHKPTRWGGNVLWMGNLKGWGRKELVPAEFSADQTEIEFEGKHYLCVGNPHGYLTCIYGDYMTPPPEKDRTNVHLYGMWWKDEAAQSGDL